MANSTQDYDLVQYLDFLTSAIITLIPGLVIHSIIIGVNVNDWWKGRSVTSVDHIVTSLGFSRMCAQGALTIFLFLSSFLQNSEDSLVIILIFTTTYTFCLYANIWLTSLLSIVFCLKISNLRTRLFLYLRRVMLPRTGHFIVASGLLSAVTCFIPLWLEVTEMNKDGSYNTTIDNNQLTVDSNINDVYYFSIGAPIPLLFYIISSVLLFASLYHHTVKMKMSSNLSINLETYYSVMKFVSITFIFNIVYFIGLFVCIFYYPAFGANVSYFHITFGFLPVLHSSYLIYRTAKLRGQMSKVLQNVVYLLFPRKC